MAKKDFKKMEEDNQVAFYMEKLKEENNKASEKKAEEPAETKVQKTPEPEPEVKVIEKKTAVTAEKKKDTKSKPVLINFNISEETKKEWKMFFLEHDINMTKGIEAAVEYMISEVRKNNISLSKDGITK